MAAGSSIYSFKCRDCGHVHDRDLTREQFVELAPACPAQGCGSTNVRRHVPIPVDALTAAGIAAERQGAKYPFVSSRLPFKLDGAQHTGPLGRNVVTSKRHYAELCKQADFKPGQG